MKMRRKKRSKPLEKQGIFEPRKMPKVKADNSIPDIFDTSSEDISMIGGKERFRHEVELLQTEWAVKHPNMPPTRWLQEIKMYSSGQATVILNEVPAVHWKDAKDSVLNALTESVVKRHIDLIAEVQETHIKASKLTLAKAVEMLSKMQLHPMKDKKGKVVLDDNGKPYYKGFRSIDLLNCVSAIEKAQMIYRRSMGLGNDEGGFSQILEKLDRMKEAQNQTNIQINQTVVAPPGGELAEKVKALGYEEVLEFIEYRREQRKALEASTVPEMTESDNVIDIEKQN